MQPEMNEVALAPSPKAESGSRRAMAVPATKVAVTPEAPATQAPTISPSVAKSERDDRTGRWLMIGTALAILASYIISHQFKRADGKPLYTAGDDVGYYLGLVGGLMMLTLLTYPLRKYLQSFRGLGAVRHWFSVHMYLGLLGPILIIAHSTFHMASTNAAVALICMLLVAGSGIVGRFIYVRIHRGLHGEKLTFQDLQSKAGFESDEMHSKFHFVPDVERRLTEFQAYAVAENLGPAKDVLRLVTLGMRRRIVYQQCAIELRQVMKERAQIRRWDREKYLRRLRRAVQLVDQFLSSVQRVSQFSLYDKLFRLWHVAHVPLVYLLVLSAIAHVVAVHMY
jgi:hypothetical protein